jgi:formylglycine-generating enzyme required for sulfatase activity
VRIAAAVVVVVWAGCASFPETNSLGMRLVAIPAGDFMMGSPVEEARAMAAEMERRKIRDWYPESPASEAPPRRTRITRGYALGATEVTVGQFRAFVEATGYKTDAERDGKGADGKKGGKWTTAPEFNWREMGYARADEQPVVNVSWNDAVAFCAWLSKREGRRYRLPTEAEWEYACRARTTGTHPWEGGVEALKDKAWTGANNRGDAQPVGRLAANAWGFHDMVGNVYEYCSDVFLAKPYDPADAVDPKGPAQGSQRVVRSVSWETAPLHARSAFRGGAPPDHRNRRDGFRVALELP